MFNLLIAAVILGLTYALTSEGLWGAALMFFNVLFAGMIAFNFYEPLAALLDKAGIGWGFSDTLCLLALFIVTLVALRLTTETLAPAMVRFPMPIYHAGRLIFGLAGACVTVAILLVAFECAPCTRSSSPRSNTTPSRRSGPGWTTSGWGSSSTRPAASSASTTPAVRILSTPTARVSGSSCSIPARNG